MDSERNEDFLEEEGKVSNENNYNDDNSNINDDLIESFSEEDNDINVNVAHQIEDEMNRDDAQNDAHKNNDENKEQVEDSDEVKLFDPDEIIIEKKQKSMMREIIGTVLFIIIVMTLIRIVLIDSYTVPSESMHSTLIPGDKLIAIKSYYGIRLPFLNKKIPGIFKPEKGQIIIFEHPEYEEIGAVWELLNMLTLGITRVDNNENNVRTVVKRCAATPGDTIKVDSDKNVIINGEKLEKELSSDKSSNGHHVNVYKETNGGKTYTIQQEKSSYHMPTPLFYVPKKGDVFIVEKKKSDGEYSDYYMSSNGYVYKINDFILDKELIYKYDIMFKDETGMNISDLKDDYYEFKIKHNYYFGMGDNRDNSRDSRSWGLIKEELIFGKPLFRFFPFDRVGLIE